MGQFLKLNYWKMELELQLQNIVWLISDRGSSLISLSQRMSSSTYR